MVDYSKWNKFSDGDSDMEMEEESNFPQVTTLNDGSRVEIGPNGSKILEKNSKLIEKTNTTKDALKHSAEILVDGAGDIFTWQQTHYEVRLKIEITKFLHSTKKSGNSLICENKHFVLIISDELVIDRFLKYDVEEKDKEGDCCIDWEIVSEQSLKFVCVTMKKKSPIPNAIQWWNKVFTTDTQEVDVSKIHGRDTSQHSVWAEAHEAFRKQVANKEKIEVDS